MIASFARPPTMGQPVPAGLAGRGASSGACAKAIDWLASESLPNHFGQRHRLLLLPQPPSPPPPRTLCSGAEAR